MLNERIARCRQDWISRRNRRRAGFTLIELVISAIIIAVLIALLLPAVTRDVRPAARRTQCKNNLKQIGLALYNYHDVYQCFPPAYTVNTEGKPLHSWRTLILPYLDQKQLYDTIDLSKSWDDPANAAALKTALPVYRCPSAITESNDTTYFAVVTPTSVMGAAKPLTTSEIKDGTSETLMVIEAGHDQSVPWMSPHDADEKFLQGFGPQSNEWHAGGRQALFADGAVRFLSQNIPAETLQALITAAAGDKVPEY